MNSSLVRREELGVGFKDTQKKSALLLFRNALYVVAHSSGWCEKNIEKWVKKTLGPIMKLLALHLVMYRMVNDV